MAIYSFSGDVLTRSKGHSATAAAAYRAGIALDDHEVGERFDYRRKRGVLHSEILAPDHAPQWMHDREALWNAVERQENRSNSQLARDIMIALPHELNEAERLDLVRGFAREQFVEAGMVADFSIHQPSARGDERNVHCHIMLTMRRIDGDGFARKKAREWNSPELMEQWRAAWADHCNQAFDRAGLDGVSVSHLSLEAQGIHRTPGEHKGKFATAAERRGRASDRAQDIEERAREIDALVAELAAVDAEIIARQESRLDERFGPPKPDGLAPEWAADLREDAPIAAAPELRQAEPSLPASQYPAMPSLADDASVSAAIQAVRRGGETSGGAGWWGGMRSTLGHYREVAAGYVKNIRESWRSYIDREPDNNDRDPPERSR